MKTMSAKDAKSRFEQFIDAAQREPIVVTKKNRPVGVFLSIDHLEDSIWSEKAKTAHAEGYLTTEESAALLNVDPPRLFQRLLNSSAVFIRSLWHR